MLYARSNTEGTAFEPQRNLMTSTVSLDGGGAIAADTSGHVFVTWHANAQHGPIDEDHRQVWLARSADDGATFEGERPVWTEPTGACACCSVRLFASPTGVLDLLYRSAAQLTNRDMYVLSSRDLGTTFEGRRLHPWQIGMCPMTSMSMAAAGERTLGAWETDGQIFFADHTATSMTPQPAPGSSRGRKHPRLAVNTEGETLLVWTEGASWGRGGAVAWQVFDAQGKSASSGTRAGVPVWSFAAAVRRGRDGFIVIY